MSKPENLLFGVQMQAPDNGDFPTIEAVVQFEDGSKQRIVLIALHKDDEPDITFYGPDGAVLIELTGNEEDEEVDRPLNLAWTGDADSNFMAKVKHPVMDIGVRVVAAWELAAQIGVHPQKVFHQMSREMDGAGVGWSAEEAAADAAKKLANAIEA